MAHIGPLIPHSGIHCPWLLTIIALPVPLAVFTELVVWFLPLASLAAQGHYWPFILPSFSYDSDSTKTDSSCKHVSHINIPSPVVLVWFILSSPQFSSTDNVQYMPPCSCMAQFEHDRHTCTYHHGFYSSCRSFCPRPSLLEKEGGSATVLKTCHSL